jgi:hypothetical protein
VLKLSKCVKIFVKQREYPELRKSPKMKLFELREED